MITTATQDHAAIVRREFGKLLPENLRETSDEVPLAQLGIDSLDFFERILCLEEEHGISIPVEELDDNVTLADILSQLES